MNGTEIRGIDVNPPDIDEAPFATVADASAWAEERRGALPLNLCFTDLDRLFSPAFHNAATDSSASRGLGAGALVRSPDRDGGSYWGAVAFKERDRENVDQKSGATAVLVHPRFDDELEINNGVATVTANPDPSTAYEMVVNVQKGDTSVTNDDNDDDLRWRRDSPHSQTAPASRAGWSSSRHTRLTQGCEA